MVGGEQERESGRRVIDCSCCCCCCGGTRLWVRGHDSSEVNQERAISLQKTDESKTELKNKEERKDDQQINEQTRDKENCGSSTAAEFVKERKK